MKRKAANEWSAFHHLKLVIVKHQSLALMINLHFAPNGSFKCMQTRQIMCSLCSNPFVNQAVCVSYPVNNTHTHTQSHKYVTYPAIHLHNVRSGLWIILERGKKSLRTHLELFIDQSFFWFSFERCTTFCTDTQTKLNQLLSAGCC